MNPTSTYQPRAERLAAMKRLMQAGYTPTQAALQLGVHERTAQRYAHQLVGKDRRAHCYSEWMPLVLAHLERYPDSLFTNGELTRVILGMSHRRALDVTLRRMEREGHVEAVPGFRDDRSYCPPIPVTRWRLARAGRET